MVLLSVPFDPLQILQLLCCMSLTSLHHSGPRLSLLLSIFTIGFPLLLTVVSLHMNSCSRRSQMSHWCVSLAACLMCMSRKTSGLASLLTWRKPSLWDIQFSTKGGSSTILLVRNGYCQIELTLMREYFLVLSLVYQSLLHFPPLLNSRHLPTPLSLRMRILCIERCISRWEIQSQILIHL